MGTNEKTSLSCIIFCSLVFVLCVCGISFGLYLHIADTLPEYYDYPEDFLNEIQYDENNALDILRNMDEGGLDLDD